MANKTGKGGFKENPQNQNKKGRPKAFDAIRTIAQIIADETIDTLQGKYTQAEQILREWAMGDFQQQKAFLEVAFGKVPDETKISGDIALGGAITLMAIDYRNGADTLKPIGDDD